MDQPPQTMESVLLSDCRPTLAQFIAVARGGAAVAFSDAFVYAVNAARARVEDIVRRQIPVYGITTGLGQNVRVAISAEENEQLQKNILLSHACSVGNSLDEESVRAILFTMLLNLGKAVSGVRMETLERIRTYLNLRLHPFTPGEGSVGYLAVEAHIALTLIGEGYFLCDREKIPAAELLQREGLVPLTLFHKEGLSLISGCVSPTALGLLALDAAKRAMKSTELNGALCYEALRAADRALDPRIHAQKAHPQQIQAASNLRRLLQGSAIMKRFRDEKVQDACILRAMPQIHGAAKQLLATVESILLAELHSCSDNPIVLAEDGEAIACMTGNFDGSFVSTHCDVLSVACAMLGGLIERRTDRLMNCHLSDGLPPFLTMHPGLGNGLMIVQYTQATLSAKLKLLAAPASVDTITTCAGQEDPVSMAYGAAQKAQEAADKLLTMTGLECMVALHAIDLLPCIDVHEAPSPAVQAVRALARSRVPTLREDRYLYAEMEAFYQLAQSQALCSAAEEVAGELG